MVQREDRGKEKAPLKGRKEQPILLLVSKTLPGRKKKEGKKQVKNHWKSVCVGGGDHENGYSYGKSVPNNYKKN